MSVFVLFLVVALTSLSHGTFKRKPRVDYTQWREDNCAGTWQSGYSCDEEGKDLSGKFCVTKEADGPVFFNDGCTMMNDGWAMIFHPACLFHDNCYHNEPATNGRTRLDCDKGFRDRMKLICETLPTDDQSGCKSKADGYYRIIAGWFPSIANSRYACVNQYAEYD
jgi:hypothetical protein